MDVTRKTIFNQICYFHIGTVAFAMDVAVTVANAASAIIATAAAASPVALFPIYRARGFVALKSSTPSGRWPGEAGLNLASSSLAEWYPPRD